MASNNIARLGVVLGLDSAQFQADIDKAVASTRNLKNQIARETNAAAAEIINLTNATADYGKTLTKLELIQREVSSGKYMNAEQKYKDELLARAAAYDRVAEATKQAAAVQVNKENAAAELRALTIATQDYGRELSKVEQIRREISGGGKMASYSQEDKDALVAQAKAYDQVVEAKRRAAQTEAVSKQAANEIRALTLATEDYGKTLTQVERVQREIAGGRYQSFSDADKQKLLAAAAAYDKVSTAAKGTNKQLTEQQKIAISYQLTDFVTQVASGQNAMIAFIQQGGQLKDQLGGIGPMFSKLASLITPMVAAIGGAVVAVGTLGVAFYQGMQESIRLRNDLILTGNYSGLLTKDVDKLSASIGNKLSVSTSEARSALMELNSSGRFTKESIFEVNEAVLRFSKLSGIDAKEAAKELSQYFDGTASSAKRLSEKYHVLTLEQYKQIEALERAGRAQEAMKLAADAFNQNMQERANNLGFLERAWDAIGKSIKDAWDALKGFGREDLGQKRADLVRNIASSEQKIAESPPQSSYAKTEQLRLDRMREQLSLIDQQISDNEQREKKAIAEANAIKLYADTGGLTGYLKRAEELYREQFKNRLLLAQAYNDEEYKAEQQALHDISVARTAMQIKNRDEGNKLVVENARQLAEVEKGILIKLNQDVKKIRLDRMAFNMQAQYEEEQVAKDAARDLQRNQAFAKIAKDEELDRERMTLEFANRRVILSQSQSVMSDKEYRIAEERLALEERLAILMQDKTYSEEGKKYIAEQMKKTSKMKESFIDIEESITKAGQKWDAVFSNMSNAIEQFVRTGKLSFNDLARSIISDLIMIEMRAQAKTIFGFLKQAVLGVGGYTDVQNQIVGEVGIPMKRASGGTVSSATPYMVGERGPELFVPGQSGTIIPTNNLSSMGGTTNVTNYNIQAIDVKSFEDRILGSAKAVWAANAYASKGLAVAQGRA